MKKIIIAFSVFVLSVQAFTYSASAMSGAIAKCENEGESVVVTVNLSKDAKLFAYQCLLNYDSEMLEYVGIGERYFPVEEKEDKTYGVLYKTGEDCAAYEKIEAETGIIRYTSSAVNKSLLTSSENVIQFTLKAKQKGESFITVSDEKAIIDTDTSLAEADTYFNVATPSLTSVSTKLSDEITEEGIQYDLSQAQQIKVDYIDSSTNVSVRNGRIVAKAANPFENDATPVVVRKHIDGTITTVRMLYADREDKTIRFSVSEFGTYYVIPCRPIVRDMEDGEMGTEAVKVFAASGAISGGMNLNYRPDDKIIRAEFIKILTEVCGLVDEKAKCNYKDVSIADWFYPYIASAREAGLLDDKSDMIYPEGTISGIEAAELIKRGIKSSAEYENVTELTRREAVELIYKNMKIAHR